MEKDTKIVLGAIVLLLFAMGSFSFIDTTGDGNSITGKQVAATQSLLATFCGSNSDAMATACRDVVSLCSTTALDISCSIGTPQAGKSIKSLCCSAISIGISTTLFTASSNLKSPELATQQNNIQNAISQLNAESIQLDKDSTTLSGKQIELQSPVKFTIKKTNRIANDDLIFTTTLKNNINTQINELNKLQNQITEIQKIKTGSSAPQQLCDTATKELTNVQTAKSQKQSTLDQARRILIINKKAADDKLKGCDSSFKDGLNFCSKVGRGVRGRCVVGVSNSLTSCKAIYQQLLTKYQQTQTIVTNLENELRQIYSSLNAAQKKKDNACRICTSNDWGCTGWVACLSTYSQTRTCSKSINCLTDNGKPAEAQACAYVAPQPKIYSLDEITKLNEGGYGKTPLPGWNHVERPSADAAIPTRYVPPDWNHVEKGAKASYGGPTAYVPPDWIHVEIESAFGLGPTSYADPDWIHVEIESLYGKPTAYVPQSWRHVEYNSPDSILYKPTAYLNPYAFHVEIESSFAKPTAFLPTDTDWRHVEIESSFAKPTSYAPPNLIHVEYNIPGSIYKPTDYLPHDYTHITESIIDIIPTTYLPKSEHITETSVGRDVNGIDRYLNPTAVKPPGIIHLENGQIGIHDFAALQPTAFIPAKWKHIDVESTMGDEKVFPTLYVPPETYVTPLPPIKVI